MKGKCWCGEEESICIGGKSCKGKLYSYLKCIVCATIRCTPMPSEALRREYYDSQLEPRRQLDIWKRDMSRASRRVDLLLRKGRYHVGKDDLILDFGCNLGHFLIAARDCGYRHVRGFEFSEPFANYCRVKMGLTVFSRIAPYKAPSRKSEKMITLFDVIEHVEDPLGTLKALSRHLHPEGVLVITTPNFDCDDAVDQGIRWHHYRPPAHLWGFSAHSLSRLLNRAGFRVAEILPGQEPNSNMWICKEEVL